MKTTCPPPRSRPGRTDAANAAVALDRRRTLTLAAAALGAATLGWPGSVRAQGYPSQPLRIVIAFPPAGATDILTRAIGERLAVALGQQVVVENRPGAGGMIGLENAAHGAPDGHNLFLCALTNQAIAGHLFPNAKADITRDFEPVALLANGPHVLNVHPSVPATNLAEFTAWLKANDSKISYASQGNGTLSHLETALLAHRLGVSPTHIPYKGSSAALTDLLAGTVSFMFDSVAASLPMVKSGKLRALAVASSQRVPSWPELPTMTEAGAVGYDVDNWFGLYAPKGTPAAVIATLSESLAKVMAEPALVQSLTDKGLIATHGDAARLKALTATERAKWGKVIQDAKITL
jgi:tripartite-type tricarboxylate transporter receptor subunit TctC